MARRSGFRAGIALALAAGLAGGVSSDARVRAEETVEAVEVGPVTSLPLPRFVSIRSNEANARRGPGLDYRIDWAFVRRGLPVEVIAEHGPWRKVRDAEGLGGWVHQSLLSGTRMALIRGEGNVPLLRRPDLGAGLRAHVEPGALARIETCEGAWCRVEAGDFTGWMARDALWGVGADEEID
jgi:SH3-like domain-containing protein